MRSGILLLILVGFAIVGCGDHVSSSGKQAEQSRIFDTQRDALDKARAVQDTVDQAATQRRARDTDGD